MFLFIYLLLFKFLFQNLKKYTPVIVEKKRAYLMFIDPHAAKNHNVLKAQAIIIIFEGGMIDRRSNTMTKAQKWFHIQIKLVYRLRQISQFMLFSAAVL